jgi:hypothetical protein
MIARKGTGSMGVSSAVDDNRLGAGARQGFGG